MVDSYHAHYERTQHEVTACSHDTRRTETFFVNTRTTILAIQQLTKVDGAVIADKATTTTTPASAVTITAVTTRVIGAAVRCGAGRTYVLRCTGTLIAVHQVVARAVVLARITGTLV